MSCELPSFFLPSRKRRHYMSHWLHLIWTCHAMCTLFMVLTISPGCNVIFIFRDIAGAHGHDHWLAATYKTLRSTKYLSVKYIGNNSHLNCGCRWKWRMITAVNCLNLKNYCDDYSSLSTATAVQIWIISYILHIISLLTRRYELNKLTSLSICGFIAQLVEHRIGLAEVTGSNPVEALIFSGFFFPVA